MENSVIIDKDRIKGKISPLLFGSFIEHLGRGVYGGIYESGSLLSDSDGFRADVLDGVRRMGPAILRWPGGNFVSGYHWMDGIGLKSSRQTTRNIAWGWEESNQFGTDEFIQYCEKCQAQPFICNNMGTGTIEEARNWVEYCNGATGTVYADMRAKNGNEKPFNVKYWGIGNEMNGPWQIGQLNAVDYAKKAREAGKLMKWTDPKIKLIIAGDCTDDPACVDWDRTVLDFNADIVDYISVHMYARNWENDFKTFMATSQRIKNKINLTKAIIESSLFKTGKKEKIKICFDEWNVFYRENSQASEFNLIEEKYNLEDALVCAEFLNAFINNCDIVEIANQSMLVNVIANIMTSETDLYFQTTFYPFELFSKYAKGDGLDLLLQCEQYDTAQYEGVPVIDISAARDDGKLSLFIVNKKREQTTLKIMLPGLKIKPLAHVYELTHEDIKAENSFSNPVNVMPFKKTFDGASQDFSYTLAPNSFTVILLEENANE